MTTMQRIALWADKLRDISALGLSYSRSVYDTTRYRAIQEICIEMASAATGQPEEDMEPLRAMVFSRPTPFTVGDAGVIDDIGRILLVRRADNRKWAMPGGALEVGETPAEGAAREALEETGVRCVPVALVGVFDSRRCGTLSAHHLYQFVFLCSPVDGVKAQGPSHADEVVDVDWFQEDSIPTEVDPGHASRIPEVFRVWHGSATAFFDS